MTDFGWNYPPGVTGNEPQIVGYPNCANCSHEAEVHGDGGCEEPGCTCVEYEQFPDEAE